MLLVTSSISRSWLVRLEICIGFVRENLPYPDYFLAFHLEADGTARNTSRNTRDFRNKQLQLFCNCVHSALRIRITWVELLLVHGQLFEHIAPRDSKHHFND